MDISLELKSLANYIAVVGSKIGIACNTTLWGEDLVSLILWYKGGTGAPLYTVDARSAPLALSKHSPSEQRFTMDVNVMPPILYINPVREGDDGEYRCRVDYRSDRTQSFNVELRTIVPPKQVIVMDSEGQVLDGKVGPYNEGYHFVAICQSEGGRPLPSLSWWSDGASLEIRYTQLENDVLQSVYEIKQLNRTHLSKQFECKASAENGTVLLRSKTITIDMNLKPLQVKIIRPQSPLSSGHRAELECQTFGSKPAAMISWWKGSKRMDNVLNSISSDGNVTKSKLIFIPTTEDNGKHISCRAQNANLNRAIEDGITLDVHSNYSNSVRPAFLVNNLPSGTSFTLVIYAVNNKGKSSPVSLLTSTLAEPEKQMSHESIDQLSLNPLLIILIAFVGVMVIISITVVIVIRIRADRYDNINGEDHERHHNESKCETRQQDTNGFDMFTARNAKNERNAAFGQESDHSVFEMMESKRYPSRSLSESQYIYGLHSSPSPTTGNAPLQQQTVCNQLPHDISMVGDVYRAERALVSASPSVQLTGATIDFGDNSQCSRRRVAFVNEAPQTFLPEREAFVADGCSDRETPIESSAPTGAMNNLRISCDGNEVT
ncbi:nephrin-like protein, partial [Dinothrombium tinctorium]